MLKRKRKPGKVLIFPHVHAFRLYPEEAIKKKLKKADIINIEYAEKNERFKRTVLWNLLSRFGVDKINHQGLSPHHITYFLSLKQIIRGIKKPIELEKGMKYTQRILLFFKFPILRRLHGFAELRKRTEYDIEQIKRHVRKGKTVAILRGSAHEPILTEFLRKEGIKYDIIPLGGIAFNPKGTPIMTSPLVEEIQRTIKKKKVPTNTHIELDIVADIIKRYPALTNYPTALFQIATGLKRTKKRITPRDLDIVGEFYIKDTITGKVIKVKTLHGISQKTLKTFWFLI